MVMMMMRKTSKANEEGGETSPQKGIQTGNDVMAAMASPDWGATPRVLGKPASDPKTLRGCQVMMAELVGVRRRIFDAPLIEFVRICTIETLKHCFLVFRYQIVTARRK